LRRQAIEKDLEVQQKLTKQKPILRSEQFVQQYDTHRKVRREEHAEQEEQRRQQEMQSQHPQSPRQQQSTTTAAEPSLTEKLKSGLQSVKEKFILGTEKGVPTAPEAPQLTEKTKSEFLRQQHISETKPGGAINEQHFSQQQTEGGGNRTVKTERQERVTERSS